MTSLLTNPWPAVIGLGLTAAVLAVWGVTGGRTKLLAAAAGCVLLAAAVFGTAFVIQTEAERVEATAADFVDALVVGDADAAVSFFTPDALLARGAIHAGLEMVDVHNDVRLTDWQTVVDGDEATCHFRANATFTLIGDGFETRHPTRWDTIWVKVGDDWRMAGVTRLNPINGEEMGMLERK